MKYNIRYITNKCFKIKMKNSNIKKPIVWKGYIKKAGSYACGSNPLIEIAG